MAVTKKKATNTRASAKKSAKCGPGSRRGEVSRETSETSISAMLDLDGSREYCCDSGVPFLDHMLESFARHSYMGLDLRARGDVHVDDHHTVEDVGLALGQALKEALGDKSGIARFGYFEAPLDEALVAVTVDLSGRPYLVYNVKLRQHRVGDFDVELIHDFMQALATAAGMNLHVNLRYGRNPHHVLEAMFKALAKALAMACARDPRVQGVPSTKGKLDG